MKKFTLSLIACATALTFPIGAATAATAATAVPYPTKSTPKSVDVGAYSGFAGAQLLTVTVQMKLRNFSAAQALLASVTTPGSANYHKFLTTEQFREQFAPAAADVSATIASLSQFGLKVSQSGSSTLSVTGTPAQMEAAFSAELHQFQVAGQGAKPGYSYHAPLSEPSLPGNIATVANAVIGLDSRPRMSPHLIRAADRPVTKLKIAPKKSSTSTGNQPEFYTVNDFAADYNVTPLYNAHITGTGQTLAIVTLATFTPSDAFAYWQAYCPPVSPTRISIVDVDGGSLLPPTDASGSDETTLDVEQSGGVAYGANIQVYEAPNTSQGFLDAFVKAVDANTAETISTSWGEWEWFDTTAANGTVTAPNNQQVSELKAFDEIFLQAALQGQSLFASAGDAGAYDANDGVDGNGNPIQPPYYSLALSVDSPASDPYMTAAGGTTLPGVQQYGTTPPVSINIPVESVWGWQYLTPLCNALELTQSECGIFPVGGGGGVSIEYSRPLWQYFVAGPQLSQPNQAFKVLSPPPAQTIYKLPGNFAGRNVPDISANADPQTGYLLYYTSDQAGFGISNGNGGTSFVAPQLNGVTALLNQAQGSRLGLLSIPMYYAALTGGYSGAHAPLRAITAGNNWFYNGSTGYNPGAGLGVLNVANFATFLRTSLVR